MADIKKWFSDNAPAILTGISMVAAGVTVPLGIVAGMKIKEELDELPEDAEPLVKAAVVGKHAIAPAATGAIAIGCAYGANKANATQYALLAGTLAATRSENDYLEKFKEKAEEKLGKKKTEEVKEELHNAGCMAPRSQLLEWFDEETGYTFWTTRDDFDCAVEIFNAEFEAMDPYDKDCGLPISRFYEILLKDNYDHIGTHDMPGLRNDEVISFRPHKKGRVLKDGTLGWQIEYEWANLSAPTLHVS